MSETETQVTVVQTVEDRVAALEKQLDSFAADHHDFRKAHISRKGPEGGRGERGETGATGPSANPQEVAKIAAEIAVETVKKAFRYETQTAKFETLIKEFESEIAALRAALKFAIIEELKLGNILDEQGNAHPNLKGERGEDSHVQGPRGDSVTGPVGRAGADGKSVSKEEVVQLIRQILDENPEKFRGLTGKDGIGIQGAVGKDGMTEEEVLNLVIKAIADPSLLEHATVKLAHVEAWVAQTIVRTTPNTPLHQAAESLRTWINQLK